MVESKAEKMARLRREKEKQAAKLQEEKAKEAAVENIDQDNPVDSLINAASESALEPAPTTEDEEVVKKAADEQEFTFMGVESKEPIYVADTDAMIKDKPINKGSKKIGSIGKGELVMVTGICDQTAWYRVEHNGINGYVSTNSLILITEQKKEKTVSEEAAEPGPITIEFEFSRIRRREKRDVDLHCKVPKSIKNDVMQILEDVYEGESLSELTIELLERWVKAHKDLKK